MIARLKGVLEEKSAEAAVVDVGGVGYLVFCPTRTLERLPPVGAPVSLHVETHVREDHIHLYGFATPEEREWFRLLNRIQGVGARVALALLSALSPESLLHAIAAQDRAMLTQASGVGPKLAGRIVSELKDRVGALAATSTTAELSAALPPADAESGPFADAVSALVNLGYRRAEAVGAVAGAARRLGRDAPLDALIRAGLKELSA
ncbi:MAG: Holliday junction branch migration protein RuvA [Rhodospirillaceae bacterium]|nr:Holliday junction branch migration protein RuvA [Rhodospirillaceae bacterium]